MAEKHNAEERIERALEIIKTYGGPGVADTADHKAWVIDQVVRVLTDDEYANWIRLQKEGEDGPDTYGWDEGVAP